MVVSSDKCYENRRQLWGYRETDPMGGHDPYSASKGCTELIVASYRRSFLAARRAFRSPAPAGNVIGGGDWDASRLVPDVLAAFTAGQPVTLRKPGAIRPWQHVLEPLSGYLQLAQRLVDEAPPLPRAGTSAPTNRCPQRRLGRAAARRRLGPGRPLGHRRDAPDPRGPHPQAGLQQGPRPPGLVPRWRADEAVARSLAWHQAWQNGADMHRYTLDEIAAFEATRQASSARPSPPAPTAAGSWISAPLKARRAGSQGKSSSARPCRRNARDWRPGIDPVPPSGKVVGDPERTR